MNLVVTRFVVYLIALILGERFIKGEALVIEPGSVVTGWILVSMVAILTVLHLSECIRKWKSKKAEKSGMLSEIH